MANIFDEETMALSKIKAEEFRQRAKKSMPVEKEKRVQLYENEDIILEQRGNKYYLSLYDKEGKFQREVTIAVKDNYKVSMFNDK